MNDLFQKGYKFSILLAILLLIQPLKCSPSAGKTVFFGFMKRQVHYNIRKPERSIRNFSCLRGNLQRFNLLFRQAGAFTDNFHSNT